MEGPAQKPDKSELTRWRLVSLSLELGFIIALPLVALGFLGKWLDARFGTEPWLTVAGILFAIISTTIWLTRKFKELIK